MSNISTRVRTPFVLLVEDSPADIYIVRESLKKHLKEVNLQVLNDGEKAFALIEAAEADESAPFPALFILDLNLPSLSGEAVLTELLAERPDQQVLILTARADISDRVRFLELGAADYVTKPFNLA